MTQNPPQPDQGDPNDHLPESQHEAWRENIDHESLALGARLLQVAMRLSDDEPDKREAQFDIVDGESLSKFQESAAGEERGAGQVFAFAVSLDDYDLDIILNVNDVKAIGALQAGADPYSYYPQEHGSEIFTANISFARAPISEGAIFRQFQDGYIEPSNWLTNDPITDENELDFQKFRSQIAQIGIAAEVVNDTSGGRQAQVRLEDFELLVNAVERAV